jgi:hypothetical protein
MLTLAENNLVIIIGSGYLPLALSIFKNTHKKITGLPFWLVIKSRNKNIFK